MGQIVGGFATSHVLFPPAGVEAQAERVFQGMMKIRAGVKALAPDVIVLAGSDHLNNFSLAQQVSLAVAVADDFTSLGDAGVPETTFPGHRAFAEGFARYAAENDFELVQVEELKPDHGMAIPRLVADPSGQIPIVPVYINANMPVPPTPARCHRLGEVLRDYVGGSRPQAERVVVIGTGGLSHWLCLPEQGRVASEFDQRFIDQMIGGGGTALAELSVDDIRRESGNGGLELTAWLFMAGALGGARGERLYYEPIPSWISGMGGISLTPASETSGS